MKEIKFKKILLKLLKTRKMKNLKLHEIIEKSEGLEEINYTHIYSKKNQLKAYYQEPVYFIATFVTNAVQEGIVVPGQHVVEAIHEIANLHADNYEQCEELIELYSFQTSLL